MSWADSTFIDLLSATISIQHHLDGWPLADGLDSRVELNWRTDAHRLARPNDSKSGSFRYPSAVTESSSSAPRSILVTGSSRGIGAEIVANFVAAGHRVAGLSTSGVAPEGALGIACDITDPEQVEAAFAEAEAANGPVEVLVANAGITKDTLVLRMSEEDFADVIAVNLAGAFRCAKRAAKSMIRARFGRIIFIGSVVGHSGSAGQVNYSASKAGLVGIARSLTRELGARGVTANVVAPGFIDTDMTAGLSEDVAAWYREKIPASRFGEVAEVAAAVNYLASDQAGYVSGIVLPVDGGLGMGF